IQRGELSMKCNIAGGSSWSALFLLLANNSLASIAPQRPMLPDFDKRNPRPPMAAQKAAAQYLTSLLPQARVDFEPLLGTPKLVSVSEGFLTGVNGIGKAVSTATVIPVNDPNRATKAFLLEHNKLFGFGPEVLEQARVKQEYVTAHNGLRTVVWEQQLEGIPLFEAIFIAHTTA